MISIVCPKLKSGGVTFNRMYAPMRNLMINYKDVEVVFADGNGLAEATFGADFYFAPSPIGYEHLEMIKFLKKWNKKEIENGGKKLNIVLDYDDSHEHILASNPYYATLGTEEIKLPLYDDIGLVWEDKKSEIIIEGRKFIFDIERNKKNVEDSNKIKANADYITVATQYLKKEFSQYNKNISVLPNSVDLNLYKPAEKHNGIRLGWIIGGSHIEDFVSLLVCMNKLLKKYKDLTIVIMCSGTLPYHLLPEDRLEIFTGLRIVEGYHQLFSMLNIDIGIAHLNDNKFNKSKSNLKILEYGACKVPVVASNVLYEDYIEDGKTGLLYKDLEGFYNQTCRLIEDEKLRSKLGNNLYKDVKKNYSSDKIAEKYYKFFKTRISM